MYIYIYSVYILRAFYINAVTSLHICQRGFTIYAVTSLYICVNVGHSYICSDVTAYIYQRGFTFIYMQ